MIIYLVIVWFLFWGLYNFVLLLRGYTTEKTPHILTPVHMLFTVLSIMVSDFSIFPNFLLFIAFAVFAWFVREKWVGRLGNSIFQIVWLYCVFILYEGSPYLAVLIFGTVHLGIFFIKHLTILPKVLIVVGSFIIAIVIVLTFIWLSYPLSLVLGVLVHFLVYVIVRPIDRRYGWKIVN